MAAGRRSNFKPEYVELAKNYCLLGATELDLGAFLGASKPTLSKWKREHPEFEEAIKGGKEMADSLVARSLYNRALGGDTTACIFWLKNRQKHAWRDRHEIDHSGKVAVDPIQVLLQTVEGTGLKPAE